MNYIQFLLFLIYVAAVFTAGIGILGLIRKEDWRNPSRFLYLGEAFLIGSIAVVGDMLLLSFLHLYTASFLWSFVGAYFLLWIFPSTREEFKIMFRSGLKVDIPLCLFFLLMAVFLFRNLFFLIDVDSHSTYLLAQKIWLTYKTSLVGNVSHDIKIFVPHFNAVPYALGLSLFPQSTLFPQFVVSFWTIVVLFLVFGYTSYRFNRWYGLAASCLVVLNDHLFYSGANGYVIINSALIAFLFASVYNFWEAKRHGSIFHLFLSILFLSQLMGNKYQMIYVTFFILILGVLIQKDIVKKIKSLFLSKTLIISLFLAFIVTIFWYVKNFIVTEDPFFPIFAGKMGVFNWTPDREMAFLRGGSGQMTFLLFVKYASYFFVWPGVNASKYLVLIILFFPFVLLWSLRKKEIDQAKLYELCFWLTVSFFATMGICLTNYTDPRVYRYSIAILSFASIFSLDYILKAFYPFKNKTMISVLIVLLSIQNFKIIFSQGGSHKRPTYQENLDVLLNRMRGEDVIKKYYPHNWIVLTEAQTNENKLSVCAFATMNAVGKTSFSAFLLPNRPMLNLWYTSVVHWDSYLEEEKIVRDLNDFGIKYIADVEDNHLVFKDVKEYAKKAVNFNREPKRTFYNYGFPEELVSVRK